MVALLPLPRVRTDVVFRRVGDEWVLFDPVADQLHSINLVAALVWRLLADGDSRGEIELALAEAFEERMAGDPLAESIAQFRDAGLLAPGT